jgi:hypothetical protein
MDTLLYSWGGMRHCLVELKPLIGPVSSFQTQECIMVKWWSGKLQDSEKSYLSATLSTTSTTRASLVTNTGFHSEKLVTNRQSHGAVEERTPRVVQHRTQTISIQEAEVTEWRKLHNKDIHDLHSSQNIITLTNDYMGGSCSRNGDRN